MGRIWTKRSEKQLLIIFPEFSDGRQGFQFQEVAYAYLTTDNPAVDKEYQAIYRGSFDTWFIHDRIYAAQMRGMRQGWHGRMPNVVGKQTTPNVCPQAVGYFALGGDHRWLDIIYTMLDYHLGGNEMNMCWVSGLGHRDVKNMQHRSCLDNHPLGLTLGSIPYGHMIISAVTRINSNDAQSNYTISTCYPPFREWGDMELWAENRVHSMTNEFTVHQQHAFAALAYAILKDGGPQHVSSAGPSRSSVRYAQSAMPFRHTRTSAAVTIEPLNNRSHLRATLVNMHGEVVRRDVTDGVSVRVLLEGLAVGSYILDVRDVTGARLGSVPVNVWRRAPYRP